MKSTKRRKPTFKQMAFETAVRNPERYIGILESLKDFEGKILDKQNLLDIVSYLYLIGEVSSDRIIIQENTRIEDIYDDVVEVNKTRRSDGGFPEGYPARFWTYMRTPSELGLVYAQYGKKFEFSEIAKKLINKEIDEQEAFSIQALKSNRKNPYRNVSNDYNFFSFILKVLLELRKKGKSLSYEQFIIAMFSPDGKVDDFVSITENNKFPDYDSVYEYVKSNYKASTQMQTIVHDYPDVVRRLFIISGFISIEYSGKKLIRINEDKLEYIQELLSFDFSLSEQEKIDPKKYFKKLKLDDDRLLNLIIKYRENDKIDGESYTNKVFEIIKTYEINEGKIVECIKNIGKNKNIIEEFKEIPKPLKLEFYITILIALKYGKDFFIRPNYKADHRGKPYSHAPGGVGDIEVYSSSIYWLIEVTLARNSKQQLNTETTSVIRHLNSNDEFADMLTRYLSFVAPFIHEDTREFYNYSVIMGQKRGYKVNIKPYSLEEFVDITILKDNFSDMEEYIKNIKKDFLHKLGVP